MRRGTGVIGAGLAGVLLVSAWVGLPTAEAAAVGCTTGDPAPQALGIRATDVVMKRLGAPNPEYPQTVLVAARFVCGGDYEYQGCSFDPARPCTLADITMRRTASATSAAARRCGRFLNAYDDTTSSAPLPTTTADVYRVDFAERWQVFIDSEEHQPGFTNACAGVWDVTAAVGSTWQYGSSKGAPFTASRAFSVRRWSHLSTDAGPEPVRTGSAVTVRGRLVRADWNQDRNVGYGGRPVQLQRRTTSGTYRTLRTVRTDREGRLRSTLRALSTERCYRWSFAGSTTTASVTSSGDCVRVSS